MAHREVKVTVTGVSQGGAAAGSPKRDNGALETVSGVIPGGAATAHGSHGRTSHRDPQSWERGVKMHV